MRVMGLPCEAIIKATVSMETEEDRLDTWVGDADSAEVKGMVGTAWAILAYALKVYADRKTLWRKAAGLEKTHGTRYVSSFVVLGVMIADVIFIQGVSRWSPQPGCSSLSAS